MVSDFAVTVPPRPNYRLTAGSDHRESRKTPAGILRRRPPGRPTRARRRDTGSGRAPPATSIAYERRKRWPSIPVPVDEASRSTAGDVGELERG